MSKKKKGTQSDTPQTAAAKALTLVLQRKVGVKEAVYGSDFGEKRVLMRLVAESARLSWGLLKVVEHVGLLRDVVDFKYDVALLLVLLFEFLVGRRRIEGQGGAAEFLRRNQDRLVLGLHELGGIERLVPRISIVHPRWARWNPLRGSREELEYLLDGTKCRYKWVDVVPQMLEFPSGTDLHAHPAVDSGLLVLQDLASALPAAALAFSEAEGWPPRRDWSVLDACAAPGNKTVQLASLISPEAKIWACDRDDGRRRILQKRCKDHGAVVKVIGGDFCDIKELDAPIDAVLLDPSCSGSGMALRPERATQDAVDQAHKLLAKFGAKSLTLPKRLESEEDRLKNLAAFQLRLLRHALSLENVTRVSYSTCSVHDEENELVVAAALGRTTGESSDFELVPALPHWSRRGRQVGGLTAEEANCLLRADPAQDLTSGFFVALFQRKASKPPKAGDKRPHPPTESSSKKPKKH